MKRTLAWVLVVATIVCMLPAFSLAITAADEPENGLNAKIYQLVAKPDVLPYSHDRYYDIIGTTTNRDPWCSFNDTVRFANALPWLIKTSKEDTGRAESGLTSISGWFDANGYLIKWEGTITADNTGDYTLVGRKIDNGFLAYVDQNDNGTFEANEVYYDYASPNHWFDGGNDRLVSQQGAFHLEAGEATAVQFWYYEADGGEACSINVSTEGGANDKSFGDAGLKLSLDKKVYTSNLAVNHDRMNEILPEGDRSTTCPGGCTHDAGNCSSATAEGNHKYDATIDALKAQMFLVDERVLPNYETNGFSGLGYTGFEYEDSMIEYTGYVTATIGGTYQFGTSKVDNCLVIEIEIDGEWVRVYEFWAGKVWNDTYTTYSDTVVTLEEGASYPIRVTYLEVDGGNEIISKIKVNGEEQDMINTGLVFTTTEPVGEVKPTTEEILGSNTEWYYMTSGEKNDTYNRDEAWYTDADVFGTWSKTTNPTGAWGIDGSDVPNQTLYLVTTFDVEDASYYEGYEILMRAAYDDNVRIYLNGTLTWVDTGWTNGAPTFSLTEEATDLLVDGTNVLAVKLVQGWGGASFRMESLYVTTDENSNNPYNYHYSIGTAQELLDYVAVVNGGADTRSHRVRITADIDMTGKDWTPMNRYLGRIYGGGHTISGITYTATVDAAAAEGDQGTAVGMFVNALTNSGDKGRIVDLNFANCHFTVNTTDGAGKEHSAIAGLVAGIVDRGYIQDVTVSDSIIDGNASYVGGVVGVACWGNDDIGVHVENCAVINTEINAKVLAGGILCYARGGDRVTMGNATVDGVTYNAPQWKNACAGTWGWGENVVIFSETVSDVAVGSTLAAPAEGDYTFYYQTRTGANGTDYRIICVANTEWATSKAAINVKISFTDGNTTVSSTQAADVAYSTVTATGDGYTDVYTAADGTVIFGWVVTGVPADFAANAPTAVVVD